MKTLYLVRHAKSSWKTPGMTDALRPLNDRGMHDATLMGKLLRKMRVSPEMIISSPATRAITTATLLADKLHYPPEEIFTEEEIYESDPEELLTVLRRIDQRFDRVMLVGHNPGLTMLTEHLAAAGIANVPTCGVVGLTLAIDAWKEIRDRCGTLLFFEYPKKGARE